MKIKQKLFAFIFAAVASFGLAAASTPVMAQDNTKKCGDVKTSIIGGDICKGVKNDSKDIEDNAIWKILILVLNIMTAGVGILAVGGIVYGAILYASAEDRADQTKKAKDIIKNVVIGILLYAGMYLILNFLIPGGIFT